MKTYIKKAIALVHKLLYQDKNVEEVCLNTYLNELTMNLVGGLDVGWIVTCPKLMLNNEIAAPLALISTELISNALKHAFIERGNKGVIKVFVQFVDDRTAKLKVEDNGKGLPEDFNIQEQEGLGFESVDSLSEQIGATLTHKSDKEGTTFELVLPVAHGSDDRS